MNLSSASQKYAQNNLNFHADSKYNNVDKDWIDVKSNNYFSNEEFQENSGPPKVDLLVIVNQKRIQCQKDLRYSYTTKASRKIHKKQMKL